jgi:hypothetical protein
VVLLDTGMSADMEDAPAAGWVCRAGGEADGGGGGGGGGAKADAGGLRAVVYADGVKQAM